LELKFDGKGQCPSAADFVFKGAGVPPPPPVDPVDPPTTPAEPLAPLPSNASVLFDLPMAGLPLENITKTGAKYQWSHDKQSGFSATEPNPAYFSTDASGLCVRLYRGDKPFEAKSNTFPRTEVRFPTNIKDNVAHVLEFDMTLDVVPSYDFCLFQLFSEALGPNVMVRWRAGQFQLGNIQGDKEFRPFDLKPADLVGKWSRWKLEFSLGKSGYLRLGLNGSPLCTVDALDCAGKASYLKLGLYAQQMQPSNDVKMVVRNLRLYFTK
jgi:hypothetical protein